MRKILGSFGTIARPFQNFVPLFLLLLLPFSATLCHAQECTPVIQDVSPLVLPAGASTTITVTGTCIYTPNPRAAATWLEITTFSGSGTATILNNFSENPTQTTAIVTPAAGDAPQTACVSPTQYFVEVMPRAKAKPAAAAAPGSACTALDGTSGVTVQIGNGLTVTSVKPAGWWASRKQDITIAGTGFLMASDPGGPSKVTVTDGANAVKLSNINVVSSTQITASVDVSKNAPADPAETATLTVTNPPTGGTPQSATANPPPVVLPVPEIDWLGRSISGDHPQTRNPHVQIGQPVELTTKPATLPGGFTISDSTWDIDGTTIKQYQGDDSGISLEETDLDTQNTTFYWLYPKPGLNVTYDYCATDPSGNQICTSPQAKAAFKATGPTASLSTWDSKVASIERLKVCTLNNQKRPYLGYGDLSSPAPGCPGPLEGTVGIRLTASGASGGQYVFVQIVDADFDQFTSPAPVGGGPTPPPAICGPHAGLDGNYPYRDVYGDAPIAYDGPQMHLPNEYESGTRNFHATMYLLWQPDQLSSTSTKSIPVPIGHQDWNFIATASQDNPVGNSKWYTPTTPTASGNEGEGFVPAQSTDNVLYGYPFWSHKASTVCGVSQALN